MSTARSPALRQAFQNAKSGIQSSGVAPVTGARPVILQPQPVLSRTVAQDTATSLRSRPPRYGQPEPPLLRYPRSVQALYLQPLRREAEYGVPSCDLQLRAYNVRSVEFFADFALRAAYYLGLPAFGPVPLPRITERWTVPRASFIFKKSQENFERVTLRRLIQIRDGNPETVQLWLAFLQKHAYPGVGMKANLWEFSKLGKEMSKEEESAIAGELESVWSHVAQEKPMGTPREIEELLRKNRSKKMGM